MDQLAACEQIQVAATYGTSWYTLIRSDQTLTFTFLLPGEANDPPHLLEARHGDGGLYDRLLQNFDQLRDHAEPITRPRTARQYRTNPGEDIEYPEEPATTGSTPSSLPRRDAAGTPGAPAERPESRRPRDAGHGDPGNRTHPEHPPLPGQETL